MVEREHLHVLEKDPAVSVHDRLREPGRARGVQDVERVIERDRLEREGLVPGEQLFPGDGTGEARLFEVCAEVGEDDRRFEGRKLALELSDLLRAVELPRAVAVSVDREQHLRLDLADAVRDGPRTELRSAGGKNRADRRCRLTVEDRRPQLLSSSAWCLLLSLTSKLSRSTRADVDR